MLNTKLKSEMKYEEKGVELLISMLLRYPMIDLLDVDLTEKKIVFTFFLMKDKTCSGIEKKLNSFKKSVNCFNQLTENDKREFSIRHKNYNKLLKIDLTCNVFNLTEKKLDFIIELISRIFNKEIYLDKFSLDKKNGFESLDDLLKVIKTKQEEINEFTYLAFREEDKIKVFNKSDNY